LSLVTLTFDLWPWHSNSSERGTKHVLPVNLAQIRSAVPEIFDAQTKNEEVTDGAKNRTLFACGKDLVGPMFHLICKLGLPVNLYLMTSTYISLLYIFT